MSHRRNLSIGIAALASVVSWWGISPRIVAAPPALGTQPAPDARPTDPAEDEEAANTHVITERADKIVASLGIADAAQATRVRDLLVKQYRGLREIHDALAAKTAEATKSPAADPTVVNAWVAVARVQTSVKLLHLHRYFVARLAVELTPEQVDKVKNGMTYGVVQVTYKRYLEMLPELTDVQKREILANLLEAREYAMDAGSSEEKHQIFGQYKGRINSYLSAAGYKLKQGERELSARQKAAAQTDAQ